MNKLDFELYRESIIKKINELFITYRKTYLLQYELNQGDCKYREVKHYLTDTIIDKHLANQLTVGIKLGAGGLTKFFTFDVDIKDNKYECQDVTRKLVNLLIDHYGIPKNDIHVSTSGQKGYHVDLYFTDVIPESKLIPFYEEVLRNLNETPRRIERRPTTGQGVKLPLGMHKATNQICHYVDNQTFEELNIEYFLNIQPMNRDEFCQDILSQCSVTKTTKNKPKINVEYHPDGMSKEELKIIFEENHLLCGGTRNNFTLYGAMLLKEQGYSEQDTCKKILSVLENTLSSEKTSQYIRSASKDDLRKETARVIQTVYDRDYKLARSPHNTKIDFCYEEIQLLISIGNVALIRLAFVLLVHAKRYANDEGIFFCTYEQLSKHGVDKNRGRVLKRLKQLASFGFLVIISQGKYSEVTKKKSPNLYRINNDFSDRDGKKYFACEGIVSLTEIAMNFSLTDEEIRILRKVDAKYLVE